jgi:predicted AlkP superfamily pyrophosphatase or phosphodiesterase
MHRRQLAASLALALACLATAPAGAETPPTVILISLDGTRPADLEGADLPNFSALRRRGAWASRLTTVFPSNTFPSHVTLVTGVSPDVHGIVNNDFVDPVRGEFHKSADPSWLLAEPLWSIAARHGVVSASYFWVGSEGPWTSGRGPRDWKKFNEKVSEQKKVEQILAWLSGPEPRPRLITAWFRGADAIAHRSGLETPNLRRALQNQDAAVGRLVTALDARGAFAHTTLLIVSDHGMAPVSRRVDFAAALRTAGVKGEVVGAGGMAMVVFEKDGYLKYLERTLAAARKLGLQAWPREETPRELRARSERFGDVVVVAPVGVAIQSGRTPPMYGAHGYAPQEPEMGALLLAVGRGAPAGAALGEQRSLDVAPTVLRLLGLPVPDTMEGQPIARLVPETAGGVTPAQEGH